MSSLSGQRPNELFRAIAAIGTGVDLPTVLRHITRVAADLAGARYAALGVLDPAGTRLDEFVTVGVDDEARARIGRLPEGHGVLGLLILDARPIRLPDLTAHPDSFGFPPGHPPMTSFLGAPIVIGDRVFGNLYLTEKEGAEEFSADDEEVVVAVAAAAAVAIDNARLHERVADLRMAEDRERIARDLHDTVVQRLFASGMALQASLQVMAADPSAAASRVEGVVDDLDETIKHIRSAIFSLEVRDAGNSTREKVLATCAEAAGPLGFAPRAVFEGPVDTSIGAELAADVVATLREALSNAARHAGASVVDVVLRAEPEEVVLRVVDDGVGPPADDVGRGRGLRNMAARAERHGGRAVLRPGPPAGSVLEWRVPRP